jgi:hypothetical protein
LFKISPPNRVKPVELISEIFLSGVALVLFNFFPHLITIGYSGNGNWWIGLVSTTSGPIWERSLLSEAFFRYLPVLNTVWILTIALNLVLLRRGRWEAWSRWALVGLKVLVILIAAVMLVGPSLISVTADSLIAAGFPADYEAVQTLVILLNQFVRLILALTILFSGWDLLQALIRLRRARLAGLSSK